LWQTKKKLGGNKKKVFFFKKKKWIAAVQTDAKSVEKHVKTSTISDGT
jgi:hypothetical protein